MTRHDPKIPVTDQATWEGLPLIRAFALLVATLIGVYVCYLLVLPFLPALAWALTIAVLAAPLQRRLERWLKNPNLSAMLSVATLALVVGVPMIFVGQQLVTELSNGVAALQKQVANGNLQRLAESHPLLARVTAMVEQQMDIATIMGNVATWATNLGASVVRGSLSNIITVLLTFYLLFYFLRDRHEALRQLRMLSPLSDSETDRLFGRAADTIYAIMFGTVITAAAQGALGGLIFWLLGLPNPLFWGLVMALLAIVPVLGAFVVWVPAAAYLALTGEWGKAAILAAWGTVVIGGIDNILHPVLAGGRLRLHTIPMFISIVGGLMLFGASGLIIGPLAVTVTLTLLQVWRGRTRAEKVSA
jgi:predicted PurR-regulated permease PerM